jgi:serine protease Do
MKKAIFIILLMLLAATRTRGADGIDSIEDEIRTVLNRVSPSMVKVVAENARKYVATGIALEDELVITTTLVTRHPFERLSVETTKGETIMAVIAGQDARSGLTLLRLKKRGPRPMPHAERTEVGNWVALVGLFYDRFPSIFQGIISSCSENELILNAPVAPGSAGGAVVNKKGELLGIIRGSVGFSFTPEYTFRDHSAAIVVSGSRSESGKLCYAIPVGQVRRIADKLKTTGRAVPGWLGINFSSDSNMVLEVLKESPAAKAGIAKGDRIEEIAGKPIASFRDILGALEFRFSGDRIDLTVNRGGRPLRLQAQLGEHRVPAEPPAAPEPPEIPEGDLPHLAEQLIEIPEMLDLGAALPRVRNYIIELSGARQLGIDVIELTADLGHKFGVPGGAGLMISRVNEGSAAKKAGLKAGDIIVQAKGGATRSISDLRKALAALKDKEAVVLELYRDGQMKKFSLLPDRIEKGIWDIRQFSRKMENLRDNISDEAKIIYGEEIKKMRESRLKAQAGLQEQKRQTLERIREESKKLAVELAKLQEEKSRLSLESQKKYAEELKRIQEEIKRLQEKIRDEAPGKADEGGKGR